jgi:hypothetical protein
MNHRVKRLVWLMLWPLAFLIVCQILAGLLLNHSKQLHLDQHHLSWDGLRSFYGISEKTPDAVFLIDNKIISQFGSQLFVDATPVTTVQRPLKGAIMLDEVIVLATDQALILLSLQGEFLDRLHAESGIPAPIQNIGLYHGEPVIQARNGMWRSDFLLDSWEPVSLLGVSWSKSYPMPEQLARELESYFYGKGIPVRQLLTDFRSGQLLGPVGIWLNDVLAVLLLLLFFTGFWVWGRKLK